MNESTEQSRVESACAKVRKALATCVDEGVRDALISSLEILEPLAEVSRGPRASKYAGSIDYTFEDEQYAPCGREVDVRVYYCWYDYDPADEPSPIWGASIEDVEVLAVRHFDQEGHEIPENEHRLDLAWFLLNRQYEEVTEACTADGYRQGAGESPITYAPAGSSTAATAGNNSFASRMAGSVSTRRAEQERRHLG